MIDCQSKPAQIEVMYIGKEAESIMKNIIQRITVMHRKKNNKLIDALRNLLRNSGFFIGLFGLSKGQYFFKITYEKANVAICNIKIIKTVK